MTALTRHAEVRMRQRGLRDRDVALVLAEATPVAGDAWVLTGADVARAVARRKHEIAQLERLRDAKVVLSGDTVVTVYHQRAAAAKRARRQGKETR